MYGYNEITCEHETASTTVCTVTATSTEDVISFEDVQLFFGVGAFVGFVCLWLFVLSIFRR